MRSSRVALSVALSAALSVAVTMVPTIPAPTFRLIVVAPFASIVTPFARIGLGLADDLNGGLRLVGILSVPLPRQARRSGRGDQNEYERDL